VLGGDANVSLVELARGIRQDPALAGGVLKIANSAAYGARGEIFSIDQALLRIGLRQTGRLALALSLHNMIPRNPGEDPQAYWRHLLGAATAASVVVRRQPDLAGDIDEESAYLLGLFHDVGLLVLAGQYAKEYRATRHAARASKQPYHVVEREVLGTDHGEMGALIAMSWGLPDHVVETIRVHHSVATADPEVRRRVELVQLAEHICRCAGFGDLAEGESLDESWPPGGIQVPPDDLDQMVSEARAEMDRSEELLRAAI
jgi:HD-like signal output (HDOD) protein